MLGSAKMCEKGFVAVDRLQQHHVGERRDAAFGPWLGHAPGNRRAPMVKRALKLGNESRKRFRSGAIEVGGYESFIEHDVLVGSHFGNTSDGETDEICP